MRPPKKLPPWSRHHESWCAIFRGKACDCDDDDRRPTSRRRPPLDEIPPLSEEELAQYDAEFTASARAAMRKMEAQWAGQQFAWLDLEPTYVPVLAWDVYVPSLRDKALEPKETPHNRVLC